MIITISGTPGSGKSTVAKYLAKKLKLKHYSVGDFMRQLAKERGMTLMQLTKLAEKDRSIDKELDRMQINLRKRDNFVIDSRIGWHFLPKSIKIFVRVDLKEGAKRIFKQKRAIEKERTLKKAISDIKRRMASERLRYKKLYTVNIDNMANYDIIIDTTGMPIRQMNSLVARAVKNYLTGQKG